MSKQAVLQQPPHITIDFPVDGEVVEMRIATPAAKEEVASFEALPRNFEALCKWCVIEAPLRASREHAAKVAKETASAMAETETLVVGARTYKRKDKGVHFNMFCIRAGRCRTEVLGVFRTRYSAL